MSNVTQIYSIVNASAADVLGSYAVRVKDTTSFVDLGRSLSDAQQLDAFFGALACRITKTVEFVRLYQRNERRVLTDLIDFGAYVQKVYTELPDAVANPVWSISNGQNPPSISSSNPYDVTTTVNISTKIFGERGTWSLEIVRPTVQIKEAFLNESAMMAFIDAIYLTVENSYNLQAEAIENLAVATAIAESLENGHSTNLLQVYNQQTTGVSLTVSTCLKDLDFLAFANKTISETRTYMTKMSKIFNVAQYATFTPEEKCITEVLSSFANASRFFLRSNTYHDVLVELDKAKDIAYWQSPGKTFAFADCSAIKIKNTAVKNDSATPPVAVEVDGSGILAFIRDEEYVKAYFGNRDTWELPNPRNRSVIHGEHVDMGFAVDPHANGHVFYIAD